MRIRIAIACAGAAALVGCNGGNAHARHGLESTTATSRPADGVVYGPAMATVDVARDTARLRAATAAFRSLDGAVAAGYPAAIPGCIAHPTLGGMGYHHTNDKLLDDVIEVERPEVLVYRKLPTGEYALSGVEYMVPFSARPRTETPPVVMGQELKPFDQGKFWYRHVWAWLDNPRGLFEDWNPTVTC